MSDEGLRVPKAKVVVELAFAGREPRTVEVFVAEHQAHAYRRQDVLDLLEHEHPFLPARDRDANEWVLFNKDTLLWVALPLFTGHSADTEDDEDEELYEQRKDVRIDLVGGGTLSGELLYSAPAEHSRAVDLLNQPGRFFRLWEPERVVLVNKLFVVGVVERKV